jgi:hypothetical protein
LDKRETMKEITRGGDKAPDDLDGTTEDAGAGDATEDAIAALTAGGMEVGNG